jgi:hypothetical protein
MSDLTWDNIRNTLRDFIYNHTEIAIWTFIVLLAVVLFWLMVYSVAVRRFMTVVLLVTAIVAYGLYYYGFFTPPDTVLVPVPVR